MLAAQLSFGEASHLLDRGVTLDHCLEHGPTGHAEDIAGDTRQLDVGGLEKPQQPIALSSLALMSLRRYRSKSRSSRSGRGGTKLLAIRP